MDDSELVDLLRDLESDRVERISSLAEREKICEAICAFANDLPGHRRSGVLFVGVANDGSCAYLSIDDRLLLTLADHRSNGNIQPFPELAVQKRVLNGCEMAVVIVDPSDAPPVRYRGRVCIRVGPRRAIATQQEERRLAEKRRSSDLPFDIQAVSTATLDDLYLEFFKNTYLPTVLAPDILEQNGRSLEHQLMSLRFTTNSVPVVPTILGVLVIGKKPRNILPGAYIQFLRIEGPELTDPMKDQIEVYGSLPEMMETVQT